MNKKIFIGLVISLLLFVTACGRSTDTSSSPKTTPDATETSHSDQQKSDTDTKSSDAKVEEAFVDFQDGKPAKMSGNGSKEFRLTMPEGGYKLVMKTKDLAKGLKGLNIVSASSNIGVPIFSSAGAGKEDSGWYVYERVEHMYSSDLSIFKVQADGPYTIEVYKLPLTSGNAAFPLKYKGAGTRALGPFAASASLTIKLKTSDAKNAGFMVSLADATTGMQTASVYMNVDMTTKKLTNSVDVSQEVTPSGSGSYFLRIEANSNCEWEAEISN